LSLRSSRRLIRTEVAVSVAPTPINTHNAASVTGVHPRRSVRLVVGVFALGVTLATGPVATAAPREGPLRVAAEVPQPGFWGGTSATAVTGGFEYDLAKAIAAKLGRSGVTVVAIPFASLVAGRAKGFDIGLEEALITKSKKSKAPIEFSTPYLDFNVGIMVRNGSNVADMSAAKRLRWGVPTATPAPSTYLDRVLRPDIPAQRFPDLTQAVTALEGNQVDAVLDYTVSVIKQAAQSRGQLAVAGQLHTADKIGAVLPKGSPLRKKVNTAIQALKADGTINRLAVQYLGGDPSTVPFLR
jgi:polar amino acid transport system substrate-binding protein